MSRPHDNNFGGGPKEFKNNIEDELTPEKYYESNKMEDPINFNKIINEKIYFIP